MTARYYILGISPTPNLPALLCRYLDPADIEEYGNEGLHMTGGFDGLLPAPEENREEAVGFDDFDAAAAFIAQEKTEGSDYHYSIWIVWNHPDAVPSLDAALGRVVLCSDGEERRLVAIDENLLHYEVKISGGSWMRLSGTRRWEADPLFLKGKFLIG